MGSVTSAPTPASRRVTHGQQREEGRRAVDTDDEAGRDESTPRDGHGGHSDSRRNRRRAVRVWTGTGRDGPTSERGRLLLPEPSVVKEPGIYFLNPCGTSLNKVSTKQQTTDLPNVKLLDLKGNPVVVSGVVFWSIVGVKAAVLSVENVYRYVNTTAMATLKQVVSQYPYEADDEGEASPSSQHRHGLSLKTEAAQVSRELKDVLQDRLAHAGVKVLAFNLTDLSYAPEIAQAMLVRQQAEAVVKARRLIVKGAVDISEDAVNQLETKGVKMSETEKTKVVTNLLTVICGDQKATPTLSVG